MIVPVNLQMCVFIKRLVFEQYLPTRLSYSRQHIERSNNSSHYHSLLSPSYRSTDKPATMPVTTIPAD